MICKLFVIVVIILLIHLLLVHLNNSNYKNYFNNKEDNKEEDNKDDMSNELNDYINNNNICNKEFDINKFNNDKIYKLDISEEKILPHNKESTYSISNFCSDNNLAVKYFKENKDRLNKFLNKLNKSDNKEINIKKTDIKETDIKIEEINNIKDEDRILNGGEFFNGIQGFTSTDLLNTYSSF